ncbi:CapA family protein [Bacillus licheniformis]|nr:CapA family protein [Bacillus licheniformis]
MHWGQEYDNEPNDRQKDLAKAIADAGADVIIGAHPHVLEPIEVYNGTVISTASATLYLIRAGQEHGTARLYNTI